MVDQAPESTRKRTGRSPSYPGIDLQLAVQRARELWDHEHHYRTAASTVLAHWGYGPKSGGGFAALAALKSFGLLDSEGSGDQRVAWLTDFAQQLITSEDETERQHLLQQAAVKPPAHKDLWNRYGGQLPSDQSLRLYLMRDRNFTPSGAEELISEWKRTMAHAGLTGSGATVPRDGGEQGERNGEPDGVSNGTPTVTPPPQTIPQSQKQPPAPEPDPAKPKGGAESQRREQRAVQVPYLPDPADWALLQARFPMTEREWDAMIKVLQSMKVGLVKDADSTD